MKKKAMAVLVALCTVAVATHTANAQAPYEPVEKGAWVAGVGIGAGNFYDYNRETNNLDLNSGLGVRVAIENGIWALGPGMVTLGGELGYVSTTKKSQSYSQYTVAARGAWHHGWDVAGLDTYAGLTIGPAFLFLPGDNVADYYSGFFIGGSYFFAPNFGVNAEFGYAANLSQIGIVYKFN